MIAAKAGKHVIIEKPLSVTLEEADEMIAACKAARSKLMYAEELCFAPKYERVRLLANEGAFGKIYMLKQAEKHSGPHTRLVLRHQPIRRRRDDGHGLPRAGVVSLDARRAAPGRSACRRTCRPDCSTRGARAARRIPW